MQENKQKTITFLIIIILILVAVVFFLLGNKKTALAPVDNIVAPVLNQGNNTENKNPVVNSDTLKNYSTSYGEFSYKNTAEIIPNQAGGVINIGKDKNDPYLETVVFFSNTYQVSPMMGIDNGNYIHLNSETYGSNIFEVYRATESGTKIYILEKDARAISIQIPFRTGGNDIPVYLDLSSVKI